MTALVEKLIERFALQEEKALAGSGLANNDVFVVRYGADKFDYPPRFMYFYYIRINENGRIKIAHYNYFELDPRYPNHPIKKWKEIPRDKQGLDAITLTLAKNARKDLNEQDPQPSGKNFSNVIWERKSLIVLFFDEANWKLYKKTPHGSSVVFLTEKDQVDYIENHSFFDAVDLDVTFSATDVRSAIAFINHMKCDDTGTDISHPPERFQFNMFLKLTFEDGTPSTTDVIIDPGGTNVGPPLQP